LWYNPFSFDRLMSTGPVSLRQIYSLRLKCCIDNSIAPYQSI